MSELTLADVKRRVAELLARPCPPCSGLPMPDCASCQGSGKVYPLRGPCPCLAVAVRDGINHHLDMDGCRLCYKRQAHRPECNNCHGTGWVANTDPWAFIVAMAKGAWALDTIAWQPWRTPPWRALWESTATYHPLPDGVESFAESAQEPEEATWRAALKALEGKP